MRLTSSKRRTVLCLVHEVVNHHASEPSQKDTESDGEKNKTGVRNAERVWWVHEDVWERCEEEEKNTESEGGVEGEEEDDRLCKVSLLARVGFVYIPQ